MKDKHRHALNGFEDCMTTANMQMKLSDSNQRHTQSNRERVEN